MRRYKIEDPGLVANELLKLFNSEHVSLADFVVGDNNGIVYHLGDSTLVFEPFYNEYASANECPLTQLWLTIAASNETIFERDFKIFQDYVLRSNDKYDPSKIRPL
jgi:hypothetical protein